MGDKIANLVVTFFVTVLLARYLGPSDFGIYSYAISITALFAVASHMGLSGLVVKEIVQKPEERGVTLGTTFGLKLAGVVVGYLMILGYAWGFEGTNDVEFFAIVIAGVSIIFMPLDIIDYWFQAFVRARHVTVARLAGLAVASLLQGSMVLLSLSVLYFVAANSIKSLVIAIGLLLIYKFNATLRLGEWRFSGLKAKELFSQGWVLYLGSIFAVIYMKVDQVMLRWLEGTESVGTYAIAAQLSEAWYFIPTAIVASLFPKLISLRQSNKSEFERRFQQLLDLLFILSLVVAMLVTIFAEPAIALLFGEDYLESADVLVIHIWASIFIFMRAAFSKWILIENALMFSLVTQGAGAVINVLLNLLLIPNYGAQGAAIATLISYACASFFSLLIYNKTRPVFFMMVNTLLLPIRYLRSWISK